MYLPSHIQKAKTIYVLTSLVLLGTAVSSQAQASPNQPTKPAVVSPKERDFKLLSAEPLAQPPANFQIPLYSSGSPNFLSGSNTTTSTGKQSYVSLHTNDPPEDVLRWYKSQLRNGGWTVAEKRTGPSQDILSLWGYKQGNSYTVNINTSPPGCEISLVVGEP